MQIKNYGLIGGISIKQIINSIPMFDALSEDFWEFANEYIPNNILVDSNYNKQFVDILKTNIWFRNTNEIVDCENNGLSISYKIVNSVLQYITIKSLNKTLFSISYEL